MRIYLPIFALILCVSTAHAERKSTKSCDEIPNVCYKIKNCADAKKKHKVCGVKKLDRDKDGVPCENVCPGG